MEKLRLPAGMSSPQPTDSKPNSQSLTSLPPITAEQASYASERARLLFGFYRKGDANDPDAYVAGITAILAEYEPEVIRRVTDPRQGIAREVNWMPTLAEVSKACNSAKATVEAERKLAAQGWFWDGNKWSKQ